MAERKSKEERIAKLEETIKTHQTFIASLEGKKADLEEKIAKRQEAVKKAEEKIEKIKNPPARKAPKAKGYNALMKMAKEKGMTVEEVAAKLGFEL